MPDQNLAQNSTAYVPSVCFLRLVCGLAFESPVGVEGLFALALEAPGVQLVRSAKAATSRNVQYLAGVLCNISSLFGNRHAAGCIKLSKVSDEVGRLVTEAF
jgi:hypothetical protein